MRQDALMVPVGEVGSVTGLGSGYMSSPDPPAEAAAMPVQRALVRVVPEPSASGTSLRIADGKAMAPFLAHLIATVQGAPQTRERRRIDPNWATTAYGAAMKMPAPAGRAVRESR